MNDNYEKDLDLNLLRVFLMVAEAGSVTKAAARLYLTQPAVSAALRRLGNAVGAPLLTRAGRGVALTARGEQLALSARPHLEGLVEAARSPGAFDPKTSQRTVRMGLSDSNETWLLPPLLRALEHDAPRMRFVIEAVQFRTVGEALSSSRIDFAISVADELPTDIERRSLFFGGHVCLFDPKKTAIGARISLKDYLRHRHVIVSYNGDLRGVVEDLIGVRRDVRVSVPTFASVGVVVDGTAILATVPATIAQEIRVHRPHLRTAKLPFKLGGAPMELLYRRATVDDAALAFIRDVVIRVAASAWRPLFAKKPRRRS